MKIAIANQANKANFARMFGFQKKLNEQQKRKPLFQRPMGRSKSLATKCGAIIKAKMQPSPLIRKQEKSKTYIQRRISLKQNQYKIKIWKVENKERQVSKENKHLKIKADDISLQVPQRFEILRTFRNERYQPLQHHIGFDHNN